ncbi:MAG TPA: GNAT family N-acetyltransferase [Acidimicrobiales bacterium]|nr:GNAT family N-acetyltransferase [Acidimicrobiales bacterium]
MSGSPTGGSTTRLARRASIDEVVPVAGLLARAFAEDPIERWCLECDDPTGLIELELLQATRQLATNGWLWVTEDSSGAAAWLPPGASYDDEAIDAVVGPALAAHGGRPERQIRFWSWVDGRRPAAAHWYVDLVAVDPDRRGSGVGRLLLADGLARVDALGQPSFLVTGNPRTVPWYERHGFVIQSEAQAPEAGPRVWFMYRPPSAPRT